VEQIIAEGNNAAVFFELETKVPAKAPVLIAEWHQLKTERSRTSCRPPTPAPYEAMFTVGKST
jgi:hypothetical protein